MITLSCNTLALARLRAAQLIRRIKPINSSLSSRRISVVGQSSYALIASLPEASLWLANWTMFNHGTMFFRLHETQFWTTASLLCSTTKLCSSAFTKLSFERLRLYYVQQLNYVLPPLQNSDFNDGYGGSHYTNMCTVICNMVRITPTWAVQLQSKT